MTDKLPPNLLMLFAPRPPVRYLKPVDHAAGDRKTMPIDGLAQFLPALQQYKDTDEYTPTESWLERKDRLKIEREAAVETLKSAAYNPAEDPNIRGDAFKTLIAARLSYDTTEQDLEHEFGRHGPIERIRLIKDTHSEEKPGKKKKPHRGYAFIVFERERDMRDLAVAWVAETTPVPQPLGQPALVASAALQAAVSEAALTQVVAETVDSEEACVEASAVAIVAAPPQALAETVVVLAAVAIAIGVTSHVAQAASQMIDTVVADARIPDAQEAMLSLCGSAIESGIETEVTVVIVAIVVTVAIVTMTAHGTTTVNDATTRATVTMSPERSAGTDGFFVHLPALSIFCSRVSWYL
ncbi:hypothetical protein CFO_g543 [Ceratocystis platani]|uniref:RRM domain-containing protein n=1 Tax=Ceratocystis fimbriata f. sp. platani TaxID=88771 RepID=A0A0F8DMN9_CERFI|nr:hypothetical protein CFO_g543 [Ceratocystis platani]